MTIQTPSAQNWIRHLDLQAHPEGGWYREIYRSKLTLPASALPSAFGGSRAALTSIYYLLEAGDFSAFHRIQSDELWYHLAGADCLVHTLGPSQGLSTNRSTKNGPNSGPSSGAGRGLLRLSSRPSAEGQPQGWVPAGTWFASEPDPKADSSWFLCACAVAPGFDFAEFELAEAAVLENEWPGEADLIRRLTRA